MLILKIKKKIHLNAFSNINYDHNLKYPLIIYQITCCNM